MGVPDIIKQCRDEKRVQLTEIEAGSCLEAYGIRVAEGMLVTDPEQLSQAQENWDFPLVMKIVSPQIMHKTDAGCAVVNITDDRMLKDSYQTILMNARKFDPAAEIRGVLVQKMVLGGTEVIIGGMRDPGFGPVIMCGLGGIFTEILQDTALRLAPVTAKTAREMIADLKSRQIFAGARGGRPLDVEAFAFVIARASRLISENEDIQEIDINPVKLMESGQGCLAVDALITLREKGDQC